MIRRDFLKSGTAILALTQLGSATTAHSAIRPSEEVPSLEITWLGGATMLIHFDGLTLLTDPAFGDGEQAFVMGDPNEMFDLSKGPNIKDHERLTRFPDIDLPHVDYVILSHMHEDHFDQQAEAELSKTLSILVPTYDAEKLASKGFSAGRPMSWGDKLTLSSITGAIEITALPAEHSPNPEIASILGIGNGYWFTFRQGKWSKTLYWTGDSFGTPTVMDALRAFDSPDIFIPHLGGVGTTGALGQISMGAKEASTMIDILKPQKVLPIHHSTYALYLEPIWEFALALSGDDVGLNLISEGTMVR